VVRRVLEAGHAAQNVALVASSLDLAALPIGGFCEDALGGSSGWIRGAPRQGPEAREVPRAPRVEFVEGQDESLWYDPRA